MNDHQTPQDRPHRWRTRAGATTHLLGLLASVLVGGLLGAISAPLNFRLLAAALGALAGVWFWWRIQDR